MMHARLHVVAGLAVLSSAALVAKAGDTGLVPGNLAVVRLYSGVSTPNMPLRASGADVFIDQFSSTVAAQTAPISSIPLAKATASTAGFTLNGTTGGVSEGHLGLAADGSTFLVGGYTYRNSTLTSAVHLAGDAVQNPRKIAGVSVSTGAVAYSGNLNMFGNALFSSVSSPGGGAFHATSSMTTGIRYGADQAAQTPVTLNVSNTANIAVSNIFKGNLMWSTQGSSQAPGIYMTAGLPADSSPTSSSLLFATGAGTRPEDFVAIDTTGSSSTPNLVYVADSSAGTSVNGVAGGGGIQRWDLIGGNWMKSYTLNMQAGFTSSVGFRGLAAQMDENGIVSLFATSTEYNGTGNYLVRVTDNGAAAASSPFTILATAGGNTGTTMRNQVFRGLEIIPVPAPSSAALGLLALWPYRRRRR